MTDSRIFWPIGIAAFITILVFRNSPSFSPHSSSHGDSMKFPDGIEFVTLDISIPRSKKFRIKKDNQEITFDKFFHLLQEDEEFQSDLVEILRKGIPGLDDQEEVAYFFECAPFSSMNYNKDSFEFVLIPADSLNGVEPDSGSFAEHFSQGVDVVSFENLGGDALLISPIPLSGNHNIYRHLEAFVRGAPNHQVRDLLKKMGEESLKMIQARDGKKIWLSTCGTGIYWLHVRLDSYPKYYSYRPYITMD